MTRVTHIAPHRRVWLVGFGPGDRLVRHWTNLFNRRPGWRHVVALSEDGPGTLVVNPLSHRLAIEWSPTPLGAMVRGAMQRAGMFFVAYETEILPRPIGLRLLTCVEIVKAVLGVRTPFVVTARQLYRWLRARGARPVLALGPAPKTAR